MFEQFSDYSEVRWLATAAAQFIGPGDKIQILILKILSSKDLRIYANNPKLRKNLILN